MNNVGDGGEGRELYAFNSGHRGETPIFKVKLRKNHYKISGMGQNDIDNVVLQKLRF